MHRSLFQPLTNMSGSDTTYPSNSGPFFIGIYCGDWLRLAWKRYQLVLEMMRDEPNEDYSELLTESWAEILYVLRAGGPPIRAAAATATASTTMPGSSAVVTAYGAKREDRRRAE